MPLSAFSKSLDLVGHCAGEGAALVPEQFRFHERRRERGAVDGDQRLVAQVRVAMDGARHQLLAGSRLAADEDGGGRRGDPRDQLGDLLHLRVLADDEVALRLALKLPEHERVAVLELLRPLALGEQVPHELRAGAPHDLRHGRLEAMDLRRHQGIAGHVDDEVHPRVLDKRAEIGGHGDIEAPGELEAGRPGVGIGHAHDGHRGIPHDHFEQGAPTLPRSHDDDLGHNLLMAAVMAGSWHDGHPSPRRPRRAGPGGSAARGSRRTRIRE